MESTILGLADTLKTQTQNAHTAAERHEFQGRLMRGQLGPTAYVAQMGQYFLVHKALTEALSRAQSDPNVASLFKAYHAYPNLFEDDLRFFSADPSSLVPSEATRAILAEISVADPLTLLGFEYVAEGSTNGGKFIGLALRRALSLPEGEGLSSLDPHGDAQRERWQAFRAGLDRLSLQAEDRRLVIAAAERYFRFVIELFDGLSKAFPAKPSELPIAR